MDIFIHRLVLSMGMGGADLPRNKDDNEESMAIAVEFVVRSKSRSEIW